MRPRLRALSFAGCNRWRQQRQLGGHSPISATSCTKARFCSQPILPYRKDYSKLPPWLDLPEVHYKHNVLEGMQADLDEFEKTYDEKKFEDIFERKVRWFLASRSILSTKKISDPAIRGLHTENLERIGHVPAYVTSHTLMKCLVRVQEDLWIPILQALVDARILVLIDWNNQSFSNRTPLLLSYYDLGLILTPQLGTSDCESFKAETDASWYEKKVILPCGSEVNMSTATTASLIWNAGKLVDSQIASEFPCIDSERAEAIGILNVLKRGKELPINIEKIDVVTDHLPNYEVLIGKRDLSTCKHADVMKAILQAAKQYTVCRFRCERRESLEFVDSLAKLEKSHGFLNTFDLKDALESNGSSSRLWGMPIIRLNQEEKYINSKLCKKVKAVAYDPDLFSSRQYYVTVPQQKLKLEALEGLVSVLNPTCLIVLVGSDEATRQIETELKRDYYSCLTILRSEQTAHLDETTISCDVSDSSEREAFLLIRGSGIPKFPAGKTLVVVFDKPQNPIHYAPGQDTSKVITVSLVLPEEKDALPHSAEEVNPFMYVFFKEKRCNKENKQAAEKGGNPTESKAGDYGETDKEETTAGENGETDKDETRAAENN